MKNKKAIYSDIEYWASILNESAEEEKQYNEACKHFCEGKDDESSDISEVEEIDEGKLADKLNSGELFDKAANNLKKAVENFVNSNNSRGEYKGWIIFTDEDTKNIFLYENYGYLVAIISQNGKNIKWPAMYPDSLIDKIKTILINAKIISSKTKETKADVMTVAEDEEIDEAGELFKVDDNYIKQATAALAELKASSPADYEQAIKYLNLHKNQNLVVSPEDFAKRRIERASQQTDAPVDTRSTAQQRADLMKAVGDKNKADAEAAAAAAKNKEQKIKSIWIKSIENNIVKLQITFVDGRVEDVEDNVTITDGDKYYKQVAQSLRASRRIAKDPRPVTVKDVQLSMIRLAYNDQRIVWFYGKDKMPESAWKYANEVKKQSRSRSTPLSRAYVTWQSEYGSKAKIYSTR